MDALVIAIIVVLVAVNAVVVWLLIKSKTKPVLPMQPPTSDSPAPQPLTQAELEAAMKTQQTFMDSQLKQVIEQSEKVMADRFKNLANEVLEDKTKQFKETNAESITQLLKPVKTQFDEFRKRVDDIHTTDSKQQGELKALLDLLTDQNTRLSEEATNLTKALTGDKKVQGDWGELQLELMLENSGLNKGKEYVLQFSAKNSEGKTLRPDAVVMLPDDRHIIIDAKVSLTAYVRYCEADNDAQREQELKDHIKSMTNQVKNLAEKGYETLEGLRSSEVVFMFIPVEAALAATLAQKPNFLQDSLQQGVFPVAPSTLIPALSIVAQLWRLADQNSNTEEIVRLAGNLHDKAIGVLDALETAAARIDDAAEAQSEAIKRLSTGRGNLVRTATRLTDLGISSSKQFSSNILQNSEAYGELEQSNALLPEPPPTRQLPEPQSTNILENDGLPEGDDEL